MLFIRTQVLTAEDVRVEKPSESAGVTLSGTKRTSRPQVGYRGLLIFGPAMTLDDWFWLSLISNSWRSLVG
jgi:hypothetical protein